jgi:hypothetical protein
LTRAPEASDEWLLQYSALRATISKTTGRRPGVSWPLEASEASMFMTDLSSVSERPSTRRSAERAWR